KRRHWTGAIYRLPALSRIFLCLLTPRPDRSNLLPGNRAPSEGDVRHRVDGQPRARRCARAAERQQPTNYQRYTTARASKASIKVPHEIRDRSKAFISPTSIGAAIAMWSRTPFIQKDLGSESSPRQWRAK